MDKIKDGQTVLRIKSNSEEINLETSKKLQEKKCKVIEKTVDEVLNKKELETTFDVIYTKLTTSEVDKFTNGIFSALLNVLKPGGIFMICDLQDEIMNRAEFELKTNGFINVSRSVEDNIITCQKPSYEIGSSAKLNLCKKPDPAIWKLDDENEETIDPDDLLDENDLKKPDPTTLRVCGTTGKRKACKDCSCGLADELALEANKGQKVDTTSTPKSSCGNCYLGDAFRCASCPYLGMPAFKPGEKIQLSDNQLKADL